MKRNMVKKVVVEDDYNSKDNNIDRNDTNTITNRNDHNITHNP